MEALYIIKIILYIVCGALSTGIPVTIKLIQSIKKMKRAESEVDKEAAYKDMKEQMKILIQAAEIAYEDVNKILKEKGSSAGPIKKDSVMLKLQSYATENCYEFNPELWSEEIDKEVTFTRTVNAKS